MRLFFVAIFLVTGIQKGLCAEGQLKYPEFVESSQILRESASVDFLDKENPQGKDAKMVFSCRESKPTEHISLDSIGKDDLGLYAACYRLSDDPSPNSRKWNHVLIFKCGTYKTDVFYSPSCDMNKVLETFAASNTLSGNKCFRTDIAFVDEFGNLQLRQYGYTVGENDYWYEPKVMKKKTIDTTLGKFLVEDFNLGVNTGSLKSITNKDCRIPLKEVNQKYPERIDWHKDAEMKMQCQRDFDSDEDVVARCYPQPKNHKQEDKDKESHVLILNCGSYEMDIFYVSSCDMEIIINSFAVSQYDSRERCKSRSLVFYGTNGNLQLREFKFSNGKTTKELKDGKTIDRYFKLRGYMPGFIKLYKCVDKLGNRLGSESDED